MDHLFPLHGSYPPHIKPLEISAAPEVGELLSDFGRTEDVTFSPSGCRLAIVGFGSNRLAVIDIEITYGDASKRIALKRFVEVTSPNLRDPHGLCFLDEEHVVIANRKGAAPILKIPRSGTQGNSLQLHALQIIRAGVSSPGSVAVSQIAEGLFQVYICNNYVHYVSRHMLRVGACIDIKSNEIILQKGLDIPDGVAVSSDGAWIAISNHNTHSVYVYRNTTELSRDVKPACILHNVFYPHGVRFTQDGNNIIVADAGAPFVHVYSKNCDDWKGDIYPRLSQCVLTEGVFCKGRYNPQEGGVKGIDIDKGMRVLAATCEHQVLAFFDMAEILVVPKAPDL